MNIRKTATSKHKLWRCLPTITIAIAGATAGVLALDMATEPALATDNLVSWEDIKNDADTPRDVLMYGMGIHAQRWSPMDTINTENVARLEPKWAFSFGDEKQRGQETQAIVRNGMIYITGSYSRMWALDAETGKMIWEFKARLPDGIRPCCDVVNRGVAIYDGMVYLGLLDASIVGLDAKTGEVVWRKKFADHEAGYTLTAAPTIVKDQKTGQMLLIHGNSGDEFGAVGKLYARNPKTGEVIWMRPMVEGHMGQLNGAASTPTGDPEAPSWPDGNYKDTGKTEAWSHGGGAPWQSATFHVETNTIIIGAGNPAPWNTWKRTGESGIPTDYDSLYTSGQAYVDASTGEVIGFYQHTPNDAWDFSGNNELIIFPYTTDDGETIQAVAHADRNGFFYVTDLEDLAERDDDKINEPTALLAAYPFVPGITWAEGIDPKTGKPIWVEGQRPTMPKDGKKSGPVIQVTPPFLGGKNWNPMAYSRDTGLFYIPSNDWYMDYWMTNITYKEGAAYLGAGFTIHPKFEDHVGALRALNPATGEVVWEHFEGKPLWAGVLATAGDLVFTGTSDGYIKAFDAKTGEELWKFQTGSGIVSMPITWEMNGKQYIGIASGYGGAVPLWGGDLATMTSEISQGGMYWVFELDTGAK